jgi:hypothetical protein
MVGFLIGLLAGGFIGISIMAVLNVASDADDRLEKEAKKGSGENTKVL